MPPELARQRLAYMDQARQTGEIQLYEHQFVRDDETIYEEIRVVPSGEDETLVLVRDITQQKQTEKFMRESEEKLARSKKMESLGLLAGGVAHDLNNVLSGIVSYPELILMDLPTDSKFREPIETIKESGHRATAIVHPAARPHG